jgi:hypothetical protein
MVISEYFLKSKLSISKVTGINEFKKKLEGSSHVVLKPTDIIPVFFWTE